MLNVTFVVVYAPYNPGETAGFADDLANRLVAEGVAVPSGWTPQGSVETAALQAFQGGGAAQEAEVQAAHIVGATGEPGEIPGGQ